MWNLWQGKVTGSTHLLSAMIHDCLPRKVGNFITGNVRVQIRMKESLEIISRYIQEEKVSFAPLPIQEYQ